MIPTQAALSMIHDAKHSPIDHAYEKVLEERAQKHAQEIEQGAIRLFMYLLQCRAASAQRDCVYLICDHSL